MIFLNQQLTDNQDLFIIERAETNLAVIDGKEYILEGIAAIFGEENNNQRIYEEDEYMPHLEYLNEKIKQRRLVGELDHPEKFDVSLKNISHLIEKLEYDKASRQVKIRVRLLDTPGGRIAKALVDAGIPVSISSRAAGSVMENKRVKIKKIFTYDLVADPGFEKAQLERVYESANFGENSSKVLNKSSITDTLNEISGEIPSNVKIYSIDESSMPAFRKAVVGEEKQKSNGEMAKYVTVDEMNEYSSLINKELTTLSALIKDMGDNKNSSVDENMNSAVQMLESRLKKLEGYTKYLAENLDKNIQYAEYLAENLDKDIEYTKYLAENLDRNISFSDYLAENLEKNISYSEYLAENLDRNISYAEYLAENLDRNISYAEYLAENLDKGIGYSEYLAEKLERNIAYSEYIAENVNSVHTGMTPLTESKKVEDATTTQNKPAVDYTNLSESINALLASANNQKAANKLYETQYKFFKFLDEDKRNEFMSLDEAKKEKVANALKDGVYFSGADVTKKWDAALVEQKEEDLAPMFIKLMPDNVKQLWEGLSVEEKERTFAASKLRKLDTPYQIKSFWNSRAFVKGQTVGLVKLNENEAVAVKAKPNTTGISNDYMAKVAEAVGARFRK